MIGWLRAGCAVMIGISVVSEPQSATAQSKDAAVLCRSIGRRVEAIDAGHGGGIFLRSYDPGPGEAALPPPLASTAFTYDNALAAIALVACGDTSNAARIADGIVTAVEHDRSFQDGRIRNAYRAGPVRQPALLPGWWDGTQKRWAEDAYQDGSQTGNAAWAGLALLAVAQSRPEDAPRYIQTARKLAGWIRMQTDGKTAGLRGGVEGFDGQQTVLRWKSTEHNVDAYALGTWLERIAPAPEAPSVSRSARAFLDKMFDAQEGMFRMGTEPDGTIQPRDRYALDALIWPLIAVDPAPPEWRRSLQFAQQHLAVGAGYTFALSDTGVWTEGTAQAALVLSASGEKGKADQALSLATRQMAPTGYLYATQCGAVPTGLKVSTASKDNDFLYFHRPHLGATAWAAIAATGMNPFTGQRIGQ